jgi:hypothetical protein
MRQTMFTLRFQCALIPKKLPVCLIGMRCIDPKKLPVCLIGRRWMLSLCMHVAGKSKVESWWLHWEEAECKAWWICRSYPSYEVTDKVPFQGSPTPVYMYSFLSTCVHGRENWIEEKDAYELIVAGPAPLRFLLYANYLGSHDHHRAEIFL